MLIKEESKMNVRLLLLAVVAVAMMLILPSCSQNPEQNTVIQESIKKVNELAEEMDKIRANIKDTDADLDTVKQDVIYLKQNPSTSVPSADVEELKSKIKTFEGQIAKLQSDLSGARKSVSAASEETSSKAETPAKTVKKAEPAHETSAREKGTNYKVKEGDTLESIAKAHGTTAAAIRSKNPLPEGREPRAGSVIFVPSK